MIRRGKYMYKLSIGKVMGYENLLFNGKSMRNAIITKLSEDKHLTSALFANSNITILIDILSYMYQCMMSNLRQAASESMWSDTIFFENATRLAKLIGYYAKGQIPFTCLARILNPDNLPNVVSPDFGKVELNYGPYDYNFSVVEHNINGDQSIVRLALGDWNKQEFISDGTKFQEFIVQKDVGNSDNPSFISQKYVRVFTKPNKPNAKAYEWTYSSDPLFLIQDDRYISMDAESADGSRTLIANEDSDQNTRFFNFYINENGDYVLKFGDGLSTAIPSAGSSIYVFYVSCTETESSISQSMKSAILNASESNIVPSFSEDIYRIFGNLLYDGNYFNKSLGQENTINCIPISVLSGYRDRDEADAIRKNSRSSFSRQNRLVTKDDYKSYLLENYSEWEDVTVQNNWEYISTFYGWLYTIELNIRRSRENKTEKILTVNNLQLFNSSDLADANNVYIWVLQKSDLDINTPDSSSMGVGIMNSTKTGINGSSRSSLGNQQFGNSFGSIKDITEHPVFLYAICRRFIPFAGSASQLTKDIINYDAPNPFEKFSSYFRVHVDSSHASNLNAIKSRTIALVKSYLFDNIKLGYTPNVPALIKELMAIDGVINITTVFNDKPNDESGNIETEKEVNGMQFCTWIDTASELLESSDTVSVAYNLPNIPCFQYFKAAQSYKDFIENSLKFKVDYSIKA